MASHASPIGLGIALILFGIGTASAADKCYCRTATGEHVELGGKACLKKNGGMQEAICGTVLNNTAWKFTGKPCPQARRGDENEFATLLGR